MAGSTSTGVGKGSVLSAATALAPTTFVDLTKIADISMNDTVGEVEDVTLDSDWDDYLPTNGAGEVTFTTRNRPGDVGVKKLIALKESKETVPWKIKQPDNSTVSFTGFVKQYNTNFANKELMNAELSIRIRTKPVYAEAAGA